MPPPVLSGHNTLTFVAVRLTTFPQGVRSLPLNMHIKLEEVIATQAQQFKGYVFSKDNYREVGAAWVLPVCSLLCCCLCTLLAPGRVHDASRRAGFRSILHHGQ